MNIPIHNITTMTMSMTAAVYLLCAMVLWLGGWLNSEHRYHSTKLQKYLSVADLISCIIIMLMVQIEGMQQGVNHYWHTILNWASYIPYLMFYPTSIVLCQQKPDWKNWLHTLGPLTIGLPVMLVWGETNPIVMMLAYGILLLYLLLLYAYSLYKLRKWDRQMCEEFSDISRKQTMWFRHLTLPFMLLPLAWIPLYFYPEQEWILIAFYLTSASLAIVMSSHALAHEEFDFDTVILSANGDDNNDNDNTTMVDSEQISVEVPAWVKRLEKAMQEQHLYRQPDLTLSLLAKEISVNRTYLSQHFNNTEAGSFYNYIASYRIEEAKTLLQDKSLPLNEIATMCGFVSQVSFSRTFKNNVGCTPTEYRKTHS